MGYTYKIYDLIIDSEFVLRGYEPLANNDEYESVDYTFRLASVTRPEEQLPATLYRLHTVCNKELFYQEIPLVCAFLIKEQVISIDIKPTYTIENCLAFFYDTIITMALMYKGIFCLRASAMIGKNGVNVFCGGYGLGKSSLATILYHNDFPFIEDNRCLFSKDEDSGMLMIKNHQPHTTLWRTMLPAMEKHRISIGYQLREGLHKYHCVLTSDNVLKEEKKVNRIYIIQSHSSPTIETEEVMGLQKTQLLMTYIYNSIFIERLDKSQELFSFLTELGSQCQMYLLKKKLDVPIKEFAEFVAHDIIR